MPRVTHFPFLSYGLALTKDSFTVVGQVGGVWKKSCRGPHREEKGTHVYGSVCVWGGGGGGGGGVHGEVVRLTLIKAKMLSIAVLACSFSVL